MRVRQIASVDYNGHNLSGALGYIVVCLNPLIYASRYEAFRRQLKQMLNRGAADPNNPG